MDTQLIRFRAGRATELGSDATLDMDAADLTVTRVRPGLGVSDLPVPGRGPAAEPVLYDDDDEGEEDEEFGDEGFEDEEFDADEDYLEDEEEGLGDEEGFDDEDGGDDEDDEDL